MSSAKLNQALDHIKEAEKALKTGLFKWNPDYDTAASEYTKAATNFKLANSLEKCKEAYLKAADMQEKLGSLFHSAKLLTQAAGVVSDTGGMNEAVDLMEKASILYREHGSPDTAAATVSKAAKMCETSLPQRSVEMYVKAADLCEDDDKLRDATGYLNKASCLEVREKRFKEAAELLNRHLGMITEIGNAQVGHRVIMMLVITHLAEEDTVAADGCFKKGFQLPGFCESDEALYCEHFIKAFEEGDVDLLKKTKCQPSVTHLDTEFARLAKSLTVPELCGSGGSGGDVGTVTDVGAQQQQQQPSPVVASDEPDEWDEGLC